MTDHVGKTRLYLLLNQPDWMQQAACKGLATLMFSGRGEPVREAKAVCLGSATTKPCPVLEECRVYALEEDQVTHGMLGGWSERERRRMRSRRRRGVA